MGNKASVDLLKLVEILSFNYTKIEEITKDRRQFLTIKNVSPSEVVLTEYNQDAHIRYIKCKFNELGLSDNLSISINKRPYRFDEIGGSEVFLKYTVKVQGLRIFCGTYTNKIFLSQLSIDECYPENSKKVKDQYKNSIFFQFDGNKFISNDPSKNSYFTFRINPETYLSLTNNCFEDVDLFISAENLGKSFVQIKGNSFDNRHVTLSGNSRKNYTINGVTIKSDVSDKIFGSKLLEGMINSEYYREIVPEIEKKLKEKGRIKISDLLIPILFMSKKIEIPYDVVIDTDPSSSYILQSNKFNRIVFNGKMNIFLYGKNIISQMTREDGLSLIYWGAYQKLDSDGKYPSSHKKILMDLKETATKNKDLQQEVILSREIEKCDHALNRKEPFSSAWQDRITFTLNKEISNYGISYIKPIIIMAYINLIFTLFLNCLVPFTDLNLLFSFFWELFNPIFQPHRFLNLYLPENLPDILPWISFGTIMQKLIYAICIYEIVKVIRRFRQK